MAKVALNERSIRREAPAVGQVELRDAYTPGFGLRISAGGARTYFAMRRVNGRLVRRTIGKAHVGVGPPAAGELLLPDARERARRILSDLQRGIDAQGDQSVGAPSESVESASAPADAAGSTFGEIAAAYFDDPSKRGGQRLRSRVELERKVRVDLGEWLGRPIGDITKPKIRALVRAKALQSPVSANRLLALIRRILRWAAREEFIDVNPAIDIDPPTEERERERVLTMDELARIWECCSELGYPFGPLIRLLMLTAQRRGEVGGLRWSEIDGNVWRLPDSRAKRGKGHLIPLSTAALAVLSNLPRIGERPDLVFTTGRPGPNPRVDAKGKRLPTPVSGWSRVKTRLDRVIASTAAKGSAEPFSIERYALPPWTMHDIRRSVATHLRDGDVMGVDRVDRLIVSKILNHTEGGMTRLYDRYSADPEQRAALEAWSRRVAGWPSSDSLQPIDRKAR